ncbi:hypothetical protein E1J38_014245 [Seonamhaeicola sediminis]|uniref:Uncharacterized protein n=1 Tax=Seonamhaeicola sediminis TaxID=2528206 RepID=A0A562YAJ3_9FLAO|nr:hypothetical protein [Seonamhaeicola sediminis]TWO31097.1 hypothetical protein E1J38_014245 [Seonamhaeicola sediminis]
MKQLIIALFCLCFYLPCSSQSQNEDFMITVLKYNIKEQTYIFGEWNPSDNQSEIHLNYLGDIETSDATKYKIMTSSRYWGPTKKITNKILVFDRNHNFLGNYYLNTKCELPTQIVDNQLIFKPVECTNCSYSITKVDFHNGIPENFYLGCRPGLGSLYSFYLSI